MIREHSLGAWAALQRGEADPLAHTLAADPRITAWVAAEQVPPLLDATGHVGDAPERALALAAEIRSALANH